MANYATLTQTLVANAIAKQLPGLTVTVSISYYDGESAYDAAADSAQPQYILVSGIKCVESGITMEDVNTYNITAKAKKLLIPGATLTRIPAADVDSVFLDNITWNIKKVKQVPGGALVTVYISET